jgi:YgiT-type zinc finger domain-containing protein
MPRPDGQQRGKDCPLCGEVMRMRAVERIERIPGASQTVTHQVREWVCPDCSYEEEVEDEDA